MSETLPLFGSDLPREPHPGRTDTSAMAAQTIGGRADTLRQRALDLIRRHSDLQVWQGLTADECAGLMRESILAVRPRLSELREDGLIVDSGLRRRNVSGNKQIVFRRAAA
jgi:hypothetical protein